MSKKKMDEGKILQFAGTKYHAEPAPAAPAPAPAEPVAPALPKEVMMETPVEAPAIKRAPMVMMADDPNAVVAAVQAAMPAPETPEAPEAPKAELPAEVKGPYLSPRTLAEMEAGRKSIERF